MKEQSPNLTIVEWKDKLRARLMSGNASAELWEWVLDCSLQASENGDVDEDVDDEVVVGYEENPCSKIFDRKWLDQQCVESGCQSRQDRLPFAFLDLLNSNGMPNGLSYGDQHAWLYRLFVRHESYRAACRMAEEELRTLQSALTNSQGTEAESNGVAMMLDGLLHDTAQPILLPPWWHEFIRHVSELPDRISPEDDPTALIASGDELANCYLAAVSGDIMGWELE